MKLHYDVSLRRLSGSGMAFGNYSRDIELKDEDIGKKIATVVQDTYIRVNTIGEEINFDLFFFDKPINYTIHRGENITHKNEGNAFGFEMTFSILE